jgi:hypothetical protein
MRDINDAELPDKNCIICFEEFSEELEIVQL